MQGKTQSYKLKLALGLDIVTHRKKLVKTSKVMEDMNVRLKSCLNVEPLLSLLL
jgi:hypothetical protein